MHTAIKKRKTSTGKFHITLLLILLLIVMTALPAAAAVNTGPEKGAISLIDESRRSLVPAGTSSAKWKKVGNNLRLKGSNGKYKKGFVKYKGKLYYFDSKGNLKIGFFTVNGKTWFASSVKGAKGKGQILTGLVKINKYYYFLDPGSSPYPGAVAAGFRKISGRIYYFDQKGHMVNGWFTVDGNKYYASCNTKGHYGALLTGVQKIGSRHYQFDSSGRLLRTLPQETEQSPRTLASFVPICQYPELPTGCEVTTLTMVLNYYGVAADKLDLADNYLPKGPIGSTDFRKAFVGNPRSNSSHGCYAPVIVNTADKYLKAKNSKLRARNVSGKELEALSAYTNAEVPVMVWGTIDCAKAYVSRIWNINGQKLTWLSPEHCMVLVGFKNGKVQIADPIYGTVRQYDREVFRRAYNSLHKQAVILK